MNRHSRESGNPWGKGGIPEYSAECAAHLDSRFRGNDDASAASPDCPVYPDDHVIERVAVQKFEPGLGWWFATLTPALEAALKAEPPVIYIRIDADLRWREVP